MRRHLLGLVLLAACGEPAVDVAIPAREPSQHVLDLADVLDDDALERRLAALDVDVVALTYETEQASCGEAFRAGRELVAAWDADVAIVAVAAPGDFTSTAADRERCLGVQAGAAVVSGGVREQIAEEVAPPLAGENDWQGAFDAAVEELAEARE